MLRFQNDSILDSKQFSLIKEKVVYFHIHSPSKFLLFFKHYGTIRDNYKLFESPWDEPIVYNKMHLLDLDSLQQMDLTRHLIHQLLPNLIIPNRCGPNRNFQMKGNRFRDTKAYRLTSMGDFFIMSNTEKSYMYEFRGIGLELIYETRFNVMAANEGKLFGSLYPNHQELYRITLNQTSYSSNLICNLPSEVDSISVIEKDIIACYLSPNLDRNYGIATILCINSATGEYLWNLNYLCNITRILRSGDLLVVISRTLKYTKSRYFRIVDGIPREKLYTINGEHFTSSMYGRHKEKAIYFKISSNGFGSIRDFIDNINNVHPELKLIHHIEVRQSIGDWISSKFYLPLHQRIPQIQEIAPLLIEWSRQLKNERYDEDDDELVAQIMEFSEIDYRCMVCPFNLFDDIYWTAMNIKHYNGYEEVAQKLDQLRSKLHEFHLAKYNFFEPEIRLARELIDSTQECVKFSICMELFERLQLCERVWQSFSEKLSILSDRGTNGSYFDMIDELVNDSNKAIEIARGLEIAYQIKAQFEGLVDKITTIIQNTLESSDTNENDGDINGDWDDYETNSEDELI